jgi:hypothetical protein
VTPPTPRSPNAKLLVLVTRKSVIQPPDVFAIFAVRKTQASTVKLPVPNAKTEFEATER